MPAESWSLLGTRYLRDYEILRVREDRYRFEPRGTEADFVVFESADWVVILPFTVDDQVIFVRQYRHGVRDVVLETPGGIMDPGELPGVAAARELLEETGYLAEKLDIIGSLYPNPALNNARCHIALATGCQWSRDPQLDPLERIDLELRPAADVGGMITSGELCHAQAIAGFRLAGI